MSAWFFVSLAAKRNDVIDIAWGLGFVVVAFTGLIKNHNHSFTASFVTLLILIWGLRLSWHIGRRNIRKSEDFRYKTWRSLWGKWFEIRSYFQIFILQGILMLLVVSPVLVINTYAVNNIHTLFIIGALLWCFGFFFESIGDHQLRKFIADPKNKGHVMDKGLWRYTRHPNYFGEITQWISIGIIALSCKYGWIGLVGPAVISFLIIKVSGVPLLEKNYKDNPEYQEYKRHTSMLIPLPVKQ